MTVDLLGGVFNSLSLGFKDRYPVVAGVTYALVVVRLGKAMPVHTTPTNTPLVDGRDRHSLRGHSQPPRTPAAEATGSRWDHFSFGDYHDRH